MKLARIDQQTSIRIYTDNNKYYYTKHDQEKFYNSEEALKKAKKVVNIKWQKKTNQPKHKKQ